MDIDTSTAKVDAAKAELLAARQRALEAKVRIVTKESLAAFVDLTGKSTEDWKEREAAHTADRIAYETACLTAENAALEYDYQRERLCQAFSARTAMYNDAINESNLMLIEILSKQQVGSSA